MKLLNNFNYLFLNFSKNMVCLRRVRTRGRPIQQHLPNARLLLLTFFFFNHFYPFQILFFLECPFLKKKKNLFIWAFKKILQNKIEKECPFFVSLLKK